MTDTAHALAPKNRANPKPRCLCGHPWPCARDVTEPIAEELAWLSQFVPAIVASPESFDLEGLMPRFGRAVAAVERVMELAAEQEHQALRWQDPFPVPSWIPQVREAVAGELLARETSHAGP